MVKIIRARQPLCRAINKKLSVVGQYASCYFTVNDIEYCLDIPTGFVFDGASIPRAVWGILGLAPHGVMDGPGLVHDFCYHYKGDFPSGSYWIKDVTGVWYRCSVPMSKPTSDELLKELCLHHKACGEFKASLVWSGVAAFGIFAWNSNDEERKEILYKG